MATIFTVDNPPPIEIHNAFVKQARCPSMFGGANINRAVARSIHTCGCYTGYMLTGITLTRVVKDALESGMVNTAKVPNKDVVEKEYYAIVRDGLQHYLEGDLADKYRKEYGME